MTKKHEFYEEVLYKFIIYITIQFIWLSSIIINRRNKQILHNLIIFPFVDDFVEAMPAHIWTLGL